jgi:hypothetical protein
VLKLTTAQTLAIDSLERKINNLSKRNPTVGDMQPPTVPEDEKLNALMESAKKFESEQNGSESGLGKPEVKF